MTALQTIFAFVGIVVGLIAALYCLFRIFWPVRIDHDDIDNDIHGDWPNMGDNNAR